MAASSQPYKGPLDPREHFTVTLQKHCTKERPCILTVDPTFGDGLAHRWPPEDQDMSLLKPEHEKHVLWRRTAGDWLAKDLGVYDEHSAPHWILETLPMNYALFEQVTHPKAEKPGAVNPKPAGKLRLDRFIFGHNGRKIRSALSLGKHLSWLLHGSHELCTCDGCKIVSKAGAAAAVAMGLSPITAPTRASPGTGKGKKKRKLEAEEVEFDGEGNPLPPKRKLGPSKLSRGRGKGKQRNEWDDDEEEEEDYPSSWGQPDDYDEEQPASDASPYDLGVAGPSARTASGRQPKLSSKALETTEAHPTTDQFARSMRPSSSTSASADPTFPERRRDDLEFPFLPRVDELVWCRVPVTIEEVEPKQPDAQRFTHWPAIVRERELVRPKRGGGVQSTFEVEFLALNKDEYLVEVPLSDLVPWLGFAPIDTTSLEKKEAVEETWARIEGVIKQRRSVMDILSHGYPVLRSMWLAAYEAGLHLASVQIRSTPTIGTGPHLIPNPDAPIGVSPLRSLYLARPTARHLVHSHIHFGPELLHSGDIVRLTASAELPPSVARHVTEKSAAQLKTTLVLQVSSFIRGGQDCPLLVRGRVYEMYELSDATHEDDDEGAAAAAAAAPLVSSASASDDGAPLEDSPADLAALTTMPLPFPAHRWRLLTPGREVDLLVEHIAGRYYPLPSEMMEDEKIVLAIVEKARRTGVMGEVGVKALGLLLGGMVSGARTPRISAPNSLLGPEDSSGYEDRSSRDKDVEHRLDVADVQGFIAAGLYIPPLDLPSDGPEGDEGLVEMDAEGELDLF